MAITHADSTNFEAETASGSVVVDFYADWCPPCKMLAPVFEELAGEYEGKIKFLKFDTQPENNKAIAQQYGIMSIPTLILFKDGQEVDRITGFQAKENLKSKLDSAFGLASP
jgi:thioredoxin 1